jgi:hypothetical protein
LQIKQLKKDSVKNPHPTMNELLTLMADIAITEIEKKKGINKRGIIITQSIRGILLDQ